jgi:hypothetical protein
MLRFSRRGTIRVRVSTVPAVRTQTLIGISVLVFGIWIAWQVGNRIAGADFLFLEYGAVVAAGLVVAITSLRDWRSGFYILLAWLLFEDLARKYLGNNMAMFFGKDVLVAIVYVAFMVEVRRGNITLFYPRFLGFFYPCLILCVAGIFNPYSPSVLYGIMGLKLNFYYMPLLFVGYGLVRNDEDLRRFLNFILLMVLVIGGLGITQAVIGHSFLNPTNLAPELRDLGEMKRVTPVSGQTLVVPSSVFVSAGRYSEYLTLMFIVAYGAVGYILLHQKKGHRLAYLALAGTVAALLFSGGRGAVAYMGISIALLTSGFLWGAPWRTRRAHHMIKAIGRFVLIAAAAVVLILVLFSDEIAPRLAFYTESFDPSSSGYEIGSRTWDYPIKNLELAIDQPTWLTGGGLGTASLGGQYVAKLLNQPPVEVWVEEGYGQLILEMGILAPILWILWTSALLYSCIRVTLKLRQTRFFPLALSITWYTLLLLFFYTYGSLGPYQNFVDNAYFWVLIGILFKLPVINGVYSIAPTPTTRQRRLPPNWARPHGPQWQ